MVMMKEERGKIAKTIFYFLHSDELNSCTAVVTSKAVNKKDKMGMEIPWNWYLAGSWILLKN